MSERVLLVGAGVIGAGWAVQLLGAGHRVSLTDPDPTAFEAVRAQIEQARPSVEMLGADLTGWRDRITFYDDPAIAIDDMQPSWVQENGPEREVVKASLLATLDRLLGPEVVIASSSSGITPSTLASWCPRHPERVLVGHPFNPVHLIPLVEVVGSSAAPLDVVGRALGFYRSLGKRPIHVRGEIPGHIANRLQAALWREAYSLVERGVATVADVDTAIAHGPGLRWALLGPLVNQHLSGGAGGLGHLLKHLGPPTQTWMDDLRDVRLTPALTEVLVAGVDAELAGIDQAALANQRDELLVALLISKAAASDLP